MGRAKKKNPSGLTEAAELKDTRIVEVDGARFLAVSRFYGGDRLDPGTPSFARVLTQRGGLVLHEALDVAGVLSIAHARTSFRVCISTLTEGETVVLMEQVAALFDWDACFDYQQVMEASQAHLDAIKGLIATADPRPIKESKAGAA